MALKKALPHFGATLKLFRTKLNLSQEVLAEMSDLDRTYISLLERGIKSPTLHTMMNITEALGIELDVFISQMMNNNTKDLMKKEVKLPLMGSKVACGSPVGDQHFIEKEISLDSLVIKHSTETFFVQAMGESMSPTIQNNDYLVIDKSTGPKSGQIILAQIDNDFTVKRYIKEGGLVTLKADNPLFENINVTKNMKFIFCGTIISIIRNNP